MAQVPIHNDGKNSRYVGTVCILPGETRHVDERLLPNKSKPRPAPAPQADPLADLLDAKVTDIIPALPDLSDEDFQRLAAMETEKDKPRVTLVNAIAEDRLRRADEQAEDR